MGDDPGRDLVPVRESAGPSGNQRHKPDSEGDDRGIEVTSATHEQRLVTKWSREELEDRYFRAYDESMVLKKHARKQEDKIKRMATKLLRLLNDKKKMEQNPAKGAKKRDIETEQLIEEMQERIRELERQTRLLQEKLIVARQQLATHLKRPVPAPYRHIASRVDTGMTKPSVKVFGNVSQSSGRTSRSPYARYSHQSYPENRADIQVDDASSLREQIEAYAQEILILKEQIQERNLKHEDEIVAARSQFSQEQRQTLQENVSLIRLQRELKLKSSQLRAIESQCAELEENLRISQRNHEQVLCELEDLGTQLSDEQRVNASLQADVKKQANSNIVVAELKEKVSDLDKENKLLKESNNKLISSALNTEKVTSVRPVVYEEATRKADVEKLYIDLEKVANEKSTQAKMIHDLKEMLGHKEKELHEVKTTFLKLKEQHEAVQLKLKFFNQNSDWNSPEFEETVTLMQQRKETALQEQLVPGSTTTTTDSYEVIKSQLTRVNADHAETINELNRTRNMLLVQHKINRDYQQEVETVSSSMAQMQRDYEVRYTEQARVLELRAARIQRLERQLKDVAHGTTEYKFNADSNASNEDAAVEIGRQPAVHLKPGENLLEIHISKFRFTEDAIKVLQDANPTSFLTWDFFHFEIQSTSPITGALPEFDFTSQYVVTVDDLFLHYINREKVTVELQQAFGADYATLAVGKIGLNEILDKPEGRLNGNIHLIGIREGETGIVFGALDFWIRLRVPIEQSIKSFKERSKTLGYLQTNVNLTNQALSSLTNVPSSYSSDGLNELHIKIISCRSLKTRLAEGGQPSPYCIFKLYTKPDHDTAIVPASNSPQFDDHTVYSLPMDSDLDRYLRTTPLEIFVFDDRDTELSAYLGVATVPLLPLAHDKQIRGEFQLKMENGSNNGTIAVDIHWNYRYVVPPTESLTGIHLTSPIIDDHSLLPGERQLLRGERPDDVVSNQPTPKPRSVHVSPQLISSSHPVDKKPPIAPRDKNKSIEQPKVGSRKELFTESKPTISRSIVNASECISSDESSESDSYDVVMPTEELSKEIQKKEAVDKLKQTSSPSPKTLKFSSSISKLSVSEDSDCRTDTDTDIVMATASNSPAKLSNLNTVVVVVSHLTLLEKSSVMNDSSIQMLFVEYRFLDFSQEELETPFALPKPKANQKVIYNFRKVLHLELAHNPKRKQLLANMIKSSTPNKSRIKFTVVSEPPDDSKDIDCEDVGYAYVDLKKILEIQKDLVDEEVQVFDAKNTSIVIGHLNLTIEALSSLTVIKTEIEKRPK